MKYRNKKHLLALSVFVVLGTTGLAVWNFAQNKKPERVFIENKTRALIVESVEESNKKNSRRTIEVSFKNKYDKPISAYCIRVLEENDGKTEESVVERGGLVIGWALKPDETKLEKFYIEPKRQTQLIVAAVLFEDGTGDGEVAEVTKLQEVRLGVRMAFQKIASIIQNAIKTDESFSSDASIKDTEEKIKQLSDEEVPDRSKRGFALAKGFMSIELNDIKDKKAQSSNFNLGREISAKLTEIEAALQKLSADSPANNIGKRREK